MKYRTLFTDDAWADLRKVDRAAALTILRKLAELETDPFGFGTTELVSQRGTRRLWVGDCRVFYSVIRDKLVIEVVRVAHRRIAYD